MSEQNFYRQGATPRDESPGGLRLSGGAILLCTLAALCVIVLNLLAISRVNASFRLAQAAADETAGYYRACLEADRDIAAARETGDAVLFQKTYRISDVQVLTVEAEISGQDYTIRTWKAGDNSHDWTPDQGLDVVKE